MIIFDELKSYVDRYKHSNLSFQNCKSIKILSFKTNMLIMLVFFSQERGGNIFPFLKKGNNIDVDLSLSLWHHRMPIIIGE